MNPCPSCSFLVPTDVDVCSFCGKDLGAASGEASATQSDAAGQVVSPPPASRGFVVGVVAAATVAVAGVGWWAATGDGTVRDGRVAATPGSSTSSTAPPATTTTMPTQLTTTSAPPKVGLSGKTTEVGIAGVFTATMPAGSSHVDEGGGRHTWVAPAISGSRLQLGVLTGVGAQDAYRNSLGRLDFVKLASSLHAVGNRSPELVSFPAGSGAQWAFSDAKGAVRVTVIDGRDSVFTVVVADPNATIAKRQLAAYLSVINSIQPT
ncbi:MAG: hypothetical protein IT195_13015 [Microthrixaceae bacterium]|nr:hypothetical protein [Microthrixaceae bacterium]